MKITDALSTSCFSPKANPDELTLNGLKSFKSWGKSLENYEQLNWINTNLQKKRKKKPWSESGVYRCDAHLQEASILSARAKSHSVTVWDDEIEEQWASVCPEPPVGSSEVLWRRQTRTQNRLRLICSHMKPCYVWLLCRTNTTVWRQRVTDCFSPFVFCSEEVPRACWDQTALEDLVRKFIFFSSCRKISRNDINENGHKGTENEHRRVQNDWKNVKRCKAETKTHKVTLLHIKKSDSYNKN